MNIAQIRVVMAHRPGTTMSSDLLAIESILHVGASCLSKQRQISFFDIFIEILIFLPPWLISSIRYK